MNSLHSVNAPLANAAMQRYGTSRIILETQDLVPRNIFSKASLHPLRSNISNLKEATAADFNNKNRSLPRQRLLRIELVQYLGRQTL